MYEHQIFKIVFFIDIRLTFYYATNTVAIIGGFNLCCLDLAPDFVGILQGLNNVGFAVQGLLVPVIVSAITTQVLIEKSSDMQYMLVPELV